MPLFIIIIINHYTTCNHPNLNIDRSYGMRPSHHLTSAGQPKAMVQKIYQCDGLKKSFYKMKNHV